MTVWSSSDKANPTLSGREGELVSISIAIEPYLLESLLELLASLEFPINPQIYHQASLVYEYPDSSESVQPVTMVEFPAYADRLSEVCQVLARGGFDLGAVSFRNMLDDIHSNCDARPAPPGAPYTRVIRYKQGTDRLRFKPDVVNPNPLTTG